MTELLSLAEQTDGVLINGAWEVESTNLPRRVVLTSVAEVVRRYKKVGEVIAVENIGSSSNYVAKRIDKV